MNRIKIVKERVCLAILALGISLAALHELGCQSANGQIAKDVADKSVQIVKS